MRHLYLLAIALIPTILNAAIDEKVSADANALRERGEFSKATEVLKNYLDQTTATLSSEDRRSTEFEIERMRRIRMDYGTSRQALLKSMQDQLTTFTEEELDRFERDGHLDTQMIDGQKLYADVSASNLLFRHRELRARAKNPTSTSSWSGLYQQMVRIKTAAKDYPEPFLLPQDFLVTASLVVKANEAPESGTVRAWLPYAGAFPYQTDQVIVSSDPPQRIVASAHHAHSTIYGEKTAVKDQPTTFSAHYVFRSWARNFSPDPKAVLPYDKESVEYKKYTAEKKPHIDFGAEDLKKISAEAGGGETNPLLLAKRLYDWVSKNTIYQYAREYSTIENLSKFCAERRGGDCGQHAILYITLCRMNGIPARWSTGWELFHRRGQGMHDWAEIFVEPYGWIPIDVDMAVSARTHIDDELTTQQAEELADWFFGNMDNLRLTVNHDFSEPLHPAKIDFRSETVDFQRGEVEANGKNLYFNQWNYRVQVNPISPAEADALRAAHVPPMPPPPQVPATPTPTPVPSPLPATDTQSTATLPAVQETSPSI